MDAAWKEAVEGLAQRVKSWAKNPANEGHFSVLEQTMDPTPDEPLLEISVDGDQRIRLEPAAFAADVLPTKVHLYTYPTLRRAVLVGPDAHGDWDVQSSEGVPMNYRWNRQDFTKLLRVLSEKHVSRGV
jgi:hypothetical protein